MNDRFIRLLRSILINVVGPIVGLGGIVVTLVNPQAPEKPTLVLACLVLMGYPIAKLADLRHGEEEDAKT